MFSRKELKKASHGDFAEMSSNRVEEVINNSVAYKKSSYSYNNGRGDERRDYVRSDSFSQSKSHNNRINFEDAHVLYIKGDSFFSKDIAEVVPMLFKSEGYNIGAMKDFVRRNRSYFVSKDDLVILSEEAVQQRVNSSGGWRAQEGVDILQDKGIIKDSELLCKWRGITGQ